MDILCIDTSQKALTVGVVTDETAAARSAGLEVINGCGVFYHSADYALMHSQTLLSRIDELLFSCGKSIGDMDAYFCVTGPGSFTGIRIGITTTRAFAQVFGKSCHMVNSLQLAAYNVKTKKRYIVPLIDAMQNKFYSACYDARTGAQMLCPNTWQQSQAVKKAAQSGFPLGDTVFVCEERFRDILFEQHSGIEVMTPQDIRESICAEALRQHRAGEFYDYEQLLPVYAAVSQAEKNLSCK